MNPTHTLSPEVQNWVLRCFSNNVAAIATKPFTLVILSQVLGLEALGKCVTFLALPGYGLSCKINDVNFLKKGAAPTSDHQRPLEVRINGIIYDSDADKGMNRHLTGKQFTFS